MASSKRPMHLCQHACVMKHQGISRRQFQRPAIGCLRAAPVPVILHLKMPHPRVALGQIRLQRERTCDRLARAPVTLRRRDPAPIRFGRVGPSELRPGERELGLQCQGFLQITDALRRVLRRESIDEVPSPAERAGVPPDWCCGLSPRPPPPRSPPCPPSRPPSRPAAWCAAPSPPTAQCRPGSRRCPPASGRRSATRGVNRSRRGPIAR